METTSFVYTGAGVFLCVAIDVATVIVNSHRDFNPDVNI